VNAGGLGTVPIVVIAVLSIALVIVVRVLISMVLKRRRIGDLTSTIPLRADDSQFETSSLGKEPQF
jgi:type II secretory pathway pseudopilin PulG